LTTRILDSHENICIIRKQAFERGVNMKRFISLMLCFMLMLTLCHPAFAEVNTITWTGDAGDGLWQTDGNRSPAKVPGFGDTASIPESATATVAGDTEYYTALALTANEESEPGEYACAILNEDETYTEYTTLDDALEAVPDGETKTIRLLKNIEHDSAIIVVNKHIIFDLNGYTLNVVNETATDIIEDASGLYVEGNASVELKNEGEFNVTGSRYGVFAECDIEEGETSFSHRHQCYGHWTIRCGCPGHKSYCKRGCNLLRH
jgi:hypothetical protein